MPVLQAIILGAVQAITEFLPISSSGHLILAAYFLDGQASPLFFDVVLHLGTAGALLFVFWQDLLKIVKSLYWDFILKKRDFANYSADSKLGGLIVIACIPAVLVGLLFGDYIEENLRQIGYVVIFSLLGTMLMIIAEFFAYRSKAKTQVELKNSVVVGLLQVFSLLPGFSRSGSTISGGMISGLTRESAARFSFLLSVPLVLAAGVFELSNSVDSIAQVPVISMVAGFVTSLLVGIVVIRFLLKYLAKHSLWVFIFYRIFLVLLLLLLMILHSM